MPSLPRKVIAPTRAAALVVTLAVVAAGQSSRQAVETNPQPGGRLIGFLVDEAGRPAGSGRVHLLTPDTTSLAEAYSVVAVTSSGPSGRFVLDYPRAGTFTLRARVYGGGEALVRELELPAEDETMRLTLLGSGRLAGRLVNRMGEGMALQGLAAVPTEFGHALQAWTDLELMGLDEDSEPGLFHSFTRTRQDGGFSFDGLRPGTYRIFRSEDLIPIDPHVYETGPDPIVLRPGRDQLILRLTTPSGAPFPLKELAHHDLGQKGPEVYCMELDDLERGIEYRDAPAVFNEDGTISFEIENGKRYAYGYFDERRPPVEEIFLADFSEPGEVRELFIGPEVEPGRIQVWVFDPHGRPMPGRDVRVHSLATNKILARSHITDLEDEPFERELPPGRYRVSANEGPRGPYMVCGSAPEMPPDEFGDFDGIVVVEPGETVAMAADLWAGGYIELELRLPESLPPLLKKQLSTAKRAKRAAKRHEPIPADSAASLLLSRIFLVSEDAEPRQLRFCDEGYRIWYASPRVLPGTTVYSAAIQRPGTYTMRIETPGLQTEERSITIRPGRDSRVSIDLRAH